MRPMNVVSGEPATAGAGSHAPKIRILVTAPGLQESSRKPLTLGRFLRLARLPFPGPAGCPGARSQASRQAWP